MNTIAHTKIFDVIQKDEVMPGFSPVCIDAPDWVQVIVEKNGSFLMTRQVRWGIMREIEEFVCGTVEDGERPLAAAKRELCEETGIVVAERDFMHLGDIAPNPAYMTNLMHIYYVNLNDSVFAIVEHNPGEHERLTTRWVEKDSVLNIFENVGEEDVIPAMKLCAISLYEKALAKLK